MEVEITTEQINLDQKLTIPDAVYDAAFLPDMLPVYYKRLFPHKPFYRWLSYGLCKYANVLGIFTCI